jgi:hypothetical protein
MHPFRRLRLIMSSPSGSGMILTLRGKTLYGKSLYLVCFTFGIGRIIFRKLTKSTSRSGIFGWSTRSYYRRPTEREWNQLPVALPHGYLDDVRPFFFIHSMATTKMANSPPTNIWKVPHSRKFPFLYVVFIPITRNGWNFFVPKCRKKIEKEAFSSTHPSKEDLDVFYFFFASTVVSMCVHTRPWSAYKHPNKDANKTTR